MGTKDFSLILDSSLTPEEVYDTIVDPRRWWSGLHSESFDGPTRNIGDEFTFRDGDGLHYSKQKLTEAIPGKRMVWEITDSALTFLENPSEWTGTHVVFDIYEQDGKTTLVFTHQGLNPTIECYESCAPAWTQYLEQKLAPLISGRQPSN